MQISKIIKINTTSLCEDLQQLVHNRLVPLAKNPNTFVRLDQQQNHRIRKMLAILWVAASAFGRPFHNEWLEAAPQLFGTNTNNSEQLILSLGQKMLNDPQVGKKIIDIQARLRLLYGMWIQRKDPQAKKEILEMLQSIEHFVGGLRTRART